MENPFTTPRCGKCCKEVEKFDVTAQGDFVRFSAQCHGEAHEQAISRLDLERGVASVEPLLFVQEPVPVKEEEPQIV